MFCIKKSNKQKKTVLIVEDDAMLSRVLSEDIVLEGFDAININNGAEALGSVKKYKPDIILLDLILPGIDGFEVLRQLESDKETKNIPVFVLSNLDKAPDVKSAKVLDAKQYFIKANTQIETIIKAIKKELNA